MHLALLSRPSLFLQASIHFLAPLQAPLPQLLRGVDQAVVDLLVVEAAAEEGEAGRKEMK